MTDPDARGGAPPAFRGFALAAAGLCVLALADMPYGYYTVVRIVACGTAAYGAALARDDTPWCVALALLAVVFNPVLPVALGREAWAVVDVGAAVLFLAAAVRSAQWATARA